MDCNYGRGVHLRTMLFWNNPFRHYHRLIIILKVIEALQLGHKTPSKTDWSSRAFLTQTHWCCSVSWWRWFVFPVGRNILNITHVFFLLVSTLPKPTGRSWLLLFFFFISKSHKNHKELFQIHNNVYFVSFMTPNFFASKAKYLLGNWRSREWKKCQAWNVWKSYFKIKSSKDLTQKLRNVSDPFVY